LNRIVDQKDKPKGVPKGSPREVQGNSEPNRELWAKRNVNKVKTGNGANLYKKWSNRKFKTREMNINSTDRIM
jgi:hypothetical protein